MLDTLLIRKTCDERFAGKVGGEVGGGVNDFKKWGGILVIGG